MSNLETALSLARDGYHVFPCHPEGPETKRPLPNVFWGQQSTTDTKRINAWWNREPSPIIGLDVKKSGLIIIDLDGLCGSEDWQDLLADHADPQAPIVTTPNGGQHIWFKQRPGEARGNGRGVLPKKRKNDETGKVEGIDVRGAGGYVIAPGSILADGRKYELHGDLKAIPVLPDWLAALLDPHSAAPAPIAPPTTPAPRPRPSDGSRERAYIDAALEAECSEVARAGKGARNETANVSAFRIGQLVGKHLSEGEALAALEQAAGAWGVPANDKVFGPRGTIARGVRAGMASPRTIPEAEAYQSADVEAFIRNLVERDGHLIDEETGEVFAEFADPTPESEDYPDEALRPGGLVEEIADWIMATSFRPCRLFATAAAMATIGAVIGRQVFCGLPRSGTNLYYLIVAPTAAGKDRPQQAIKQLLEAAGMADRAKPHYASAAKLGTSLQTSPVQVQVIDEIAKVFRGFQSRNASSSQLELSDDYCSIWSTNLGTFSPCGSLSRSDLIIKRPSLSIFGGTTPSAFYEQMRSKLIAGGLLNRFVVFHRYKRPEENPAVLPEEEIPQRLIDAIRALKTFQDHGETQLPSYVSDMADAVPKAFFMPVEPSAQPEIDAFAAKAKAMVERADDDPVFEIWGRAVETVKRMAAIIAAGKAWKKMEHASITRADVAFSAKLVEWALAGFVKGLQENMAENEHQANFKRVLSLIPAGRVVGRNELYRKLDGKIDGRALDNIIAMMVNSEMIFEKKEAATAKGGRPKTTYQRLKT